MSRIKPAEIRFYVDADVLGLAHVLVKIRPDVTYPGDPGGVVHKRERPPCPVTTTKTDDDVWIPEVTSRGWLIISRDSKIKVHRREIQAVREHGATMVALAGYAKGTFAQLEILMCHWRQVWQVRKQVRPFHFHRCTD